jgi:HlyD family secretion protein
MRATQALITSYSLLLVVLVGCFFQTATVIEGYIDADFVRVAPTTGGVLQQRYVEQGQRVSIDQRLFSLDLTELQAQKNSLQAQKNQLEVQAAKAQRDYDRIGFLSTSGASTETQLDEVTTTLLSLKYQIKSLEQKIIQADKKIEQAAPKSSVQGLVQDTYYEPGEFVPAGKPVVNLLPDDSIKFRFFVPQSLVPSLRVGQKVQIVLDGSALPFQAEISFIAPNVEYTPPVIYSVESRSKLVVLVEARPLSYEAALRPGLPVSIVI